MDVNLSIEQHPPETLCDCEYDIGSTALSSLYRIIKDRNVESETIISFYFGRERI